MIALITLLNICHLFGDFSPLSTSKMLQAKEKGTPSIPIFLHASIHGLLMLSVLVFFCSIKLAIILCLFEIVTHFLIDTWKGKMNVWFPIFSDNKNKYHWMLFGFDQFLHQLVIVSIVHLAFINQQQLFEGHVH
ncbi:MAG: DUF3307 domain-containing protein [Bacteroidetes bacterium]|nr:DUF3307 domain-containing protein [Bacteroidota bacterium]